MPTFFKDQKLVLVYAHCETGLGTENIDASVTDANTGKSHVVAARGARKYRNAEYRSRRTTEDNRLYDMHSKFQEDLEFGDGTLTKAAQENAPEELAALTQWSGGHTTDRLIILAYDAGEPLPDLSSSNVVATRRGGTELVAEFLLSKFASWDCVPVKRWVRVDGLSITDEEERALRRAASRNIDLNLYRLDWVFDYSLLDNFYDLSSTYEVVLDYDDCETFNRVTYNIDQDALSEMHDWIRVPRELRDLLTPEQDRIWREEVVPAIIREHLDYIGIELFGQALDDCRAAGAREYLRREGKAWVEAMREYLPNDE
jgi:hypothetical protein